MLDKIKRFRGASTWIAETLGVKNPTLSNFLAERTESAYLRKEVPLLIAALEASNGACMYAKQSVRSKYQKDRSQKKKAGGK